MLLPSLTLMLLTVASVQAQGPPGVPPRQQQFQQPPASQQQHHQQQQQQQQQFQQQQLNVQEGQGHGHGHGHGGNKLKFQSEIHNADHIIEHLQNVINTKPKDQMSEEELEFHYFKMHDYDNNNKLDGVEIGKALTHFHDDDHKEQPADGGTPTPSSPSDSHSGSGSAPGQGSDSGGDPQVKTGSHKMYTDDVIASLVDVVLKSYDKDDDGYVEYFEYKAFKDSVETHEHEQQQAAAPGQEESKPPVKVFSDEEIANIVDTVILDNDEDGDGYVEYFEFKRKQESQRQQYKNEDQQGGQGHH